jgi:glycosyltransferase involved in cell wall biosynthesis
MQGTLSDFIFNGYCAVLATQILYWVFVHGKVLLHKPQSLENASPEPVSIVVAARNEEDNLQQLIPALLEQRGVDFELIIVDDCSLDDTYSVMRSFAERHKNIKISRIQETPTFSGGKKMAITIGVKAASHEHLVFIDADCLPASDTWLYEMAVALDQRPIVLGYSPLRKTPGILNKLIRFDTFLIGMQYLGFAKLGMPYMGVGRNMGYRSNIFFDQKGFSSHYDIASGDDDLLLNAVASASNTKVVFSPETFTYSDAKSTFKKWILQKNRHLTTSPRYRFSHLLTLGFMSFSQYATFGLLIVLLGMNAWVLESAILFGVRYTVQQVVSILNLRKTNETDLIPVSLFGELFYLFFYPMLVVRQTIAKTNEWKR